MKDNFLQKRRIENDKNQEMLAVKLRTGVIDICDLEVDEVFDMIDYFVNDSEAIDLELERIKVHILSMQKQLKAYG